MTDEVAYGIDVILHLLGERQRAAHQPKDLLSEYIVEPLDVVGFTCMLGNSLVLSRGNPIGVSGVLVGIECRSRYTTGILAPSCLALLRLQSPS